METPNLDSHTVAQLGSERLSGNVWCGLDFWTRKLPGGEKQKKIVTVKDPSIHVVFTMLIFSYFNFTFFTYKVYKISFSAKLFK